MYWGDRKNDSRYVVVKVFDLRHEPRLTEDKSGVVNTSRLLTVLA